MSLLLLHYKESFLRGEAESRASFISVSQDHISSLIAQMHSRHSSMEQFSYCCVFLDMVKPPELARTHMESGREREEEREGRKEGVREGGRELGGERCGGGSSNAT